jgi:hypothetical protein
MQISCLRGLEKRTDLPARAVCGTVCPRHKLNARVVKWQTRTFEGRMPKGMGVQVPPRAPSTSRKLRQDRFLHVQPIFCLIENNLRVRFEGFLVDLLPTVRGQAMHHQCVGFRQFHD